MKLATVSLLGTTLVFAGTSIYLARELGSTRDALAEAEARAPQDARNPGRDPDEPPPDVAMAVPEQSADLAADMVPMPAPLPAAPPNPGVAEPPTLAERGRNLSLSPAEQRQRRLGQERRLRERFADMPRELGIDSATADRLFDLLADSQVAAQDQSRAYAGDPAGAKSVADAARQERDAALNALLGPDKAADFLSYEKSIPARMQVGRIDADMTASDIPLRDDQRKAMIAAIAEVQEKYPQPARVPDDNGADYQLKFLEWQTEYSKRVQSGVEPLLTSDQRTRYREAVELQNSRRAAQRKRAEARQSSNDRRE